MSVTFRVVTWNLHHASATSQAWDCLLEIDPDLALLQGVGTIPFTVAQAYNYRLVRAMGQTALQRFHTAVLVRGEIGFSIPLTGPCDWIDTILAAYAGNLLTLEVRPRSGPPLKVMSVYSPPFKIPERYLDGSDLSVLKRTQESGLWLTDVLLSALEYRPPQPDEHWITAGDFNLAGTFDSEPRWAGGDTAWLDRMSTLGFTECLLQTRRVPTTTFRNSSRSIRHQLDRIFVSQSLAPQLVSCETGPHETISASPLLSDHPPIIASFSL